MYFTICLKKHKIIFRIDGYLAEISAFFWDSEVSLLVGTSEESRIVEILGVAVVFLAPAEAHPEEIVWLAAFRYNLRETYLSEFILQWMGYVLLGKFLSIKNISIIC